MAIFKVILVGLLLTLHYGSLKEMPVHLKGSKKVNLGQVREEWEKPNDDDCSKTSQKRHIIHPKLSWRVDPGSKTLFLNLESRINHIRPRV